MEAKVHLDLCTSDDDANGGLFNFFRKIPCEQYLREVNAPFAWEIEQHEHDIHFLHAQELECVEHKCQGATKRKRKQRAREKAVHISLFSYSTIF